MLHAAVFGSQEGFCPLPSHFPDSTTRRNASFKRRRDSKERSGCFAIEKLARSVIIKTRRKTFCIWLNVASCWGNQYDRAQIKPQQRYSEDVINSSDSVDSR